MSASNLPSRGNRDGTGRGRRRRAGTPTSRSAPGRRPAGPPAHMSRRAARRARESSGSTTAEPRTRPASFVRADGSPGRSSARRDLPVLGRDRSGLRTLAQILGEDTCCPRSGSVRPADLVLAASMRLSGAGLIPLARHAPDRARPGPHRHDLGSGAHRRWARPWPALGRGQPRIVREYAQAAPLSIARRRSVHTAR